MIVACLVACREEIAVHDSMVTVPAGWFSDGCSRSLLSADTDHRKHYTKISMCVQADPPRRVWLSTFEVDRYEVTAHDYHACVDSLRCSDAIDRPYDHTPAWLTYKQAEQFCKWRGKEIPTKAQWQKAFRGPSDQLFPWGNFPPTCAHATRIADVHSFDLACAMGDKPRAVGRFPLGQSPYGAYDMEDNEDEWVRDLPRTNPRLSLEHSYETAGAIPAFDPRFLIERFSGFAIVSVDWSTIEVTRSDPDVTDPLDESGALAESSKPNVGSSRLARDDRGFYGNDRAAVRCVRAGTPEPAPEVILPANVPIPPYREPGYVPPTGELYDPYGVAP